MIRMWWFVAVLAFITACCAAAGDTVFAGGEKTMEIERRFLRVRLNDYGEPSANKGHDPRGKVGKPPKKRNS